MCVVTAKVWCISSNFKSWNWWRLPSFRCCSFVFCYCNHGNLFCAVEIPQFDTLCKYLTCSQKLASTHLSLLHCDRTVHVTLDLSSWLDSQMFWAPWHRSMPSYSQPSSSSSAWKRGGVWMCKLGVISPEWLKIEVMLLLSANRKSSIGTTTDDLEWPWMAVSLFVSGICWGRAW